jgi:protein TonB
MDLRLRSSTEGNRAVIAGDDEDDGDRSFAFNLASDIVELVVLTGDGAFLQTLREALGGSRRLWHVPSSDKVGDLLVAGEVGILVLDSQALQNPPAGVITYIKNQFPDLVVVLAGDRDVENSVAPLISDGTIYRFIHKPMSPGRAKLFVEAAVKRHADQRRRRAQAPAVVASPRMPAGLLVIAVLGIGLVCVGALLALRSHSQASLRQAADAGAATAATPSMLLQQAAAALAANRLTEPSGNNALELYLRELSLDPGSSAARAGLAEIRERLYARAQVALLEERLDPAATAIETARKAGVESGRIALLLAELSKARDEAKSRRRPVPAKTGAAPALEPERTEPIPRPVPTNTAGASASPPAATPSVAPSAAIAVPSSAAAAPSAAPAAPGASDLPPGPAAAAPGEPAAPNSQSPAATDSQAAKTGTSDEID